MPTPLYGLFDYLPPAGDSSLPQPGVRVQVPFGRGHKVGILLALQTESDIEPKRLKRVQQVIDHTPLLPPDILDLARWAAGYYHHPLGEVLSACLPVALRQGRAASAPGEPGLRCTIAGQTASETQRKRSPAQAQVLDLLNQHPAGLSRTALRLAGCSPQAVRAALQRGWLEAIEMEPQPTAASLPEPGPPLNAAQQAAVTTLQAGAGRYGCFLLAGVTGSGKTEVYLEAIRNTLSAQRQVLVLVPEIALTPQLLARFRQRLGIEPLLLHSGLSDGERLTAWLAARAGRAEVVIGTRSAAWVPLPRAGLFIVDEEHDASLKQQEGLRYSARDLLIWRAHQNNIPILLGSATPALESLYNAQQGRYQLLELPSRAGAAKPPRLALLDVRNQRLDEGLSPALIAGMQRHLAQGNQVLLFLNRRGYAPSLLCHACGWVAACRRCDTHMTLHLAQQALRCHHCGSQHRIPQQCPHCGCADLRAIGAGTERVEQALQRHFEAVTTVRIDRDNTRRKGRLESLLAQATAGHARILLGTQMLAKGHHFPQVTLVGILDADQGLFSADFRASERLAQQVLQVAGRAGRAQQPGEVLIQTHHPEHPLLQQLIHAGYAAFAAAALDERRAARLPPFSNLALVRAEANQTPAPEAFLTAALACLPAQLTTGIDIWGPVAAPMPRRAGRYRAQLLLLARDRRRLQALLQAWVPQVAALKAARRVRWSLDVDPIDLY